MAGGSEQWREKVEKAGKEGNQDEEEEGGRKNVSKEKLKELERKEMSQESVVNSSVSTAQSSFLKGNSGSPTKHTR